MSKIINQLEQRSQELKLTKLLELSMEQYKLYKLAKYLLSIGYYSTYDYAKFLKANNINLF